MKCIRQLNILSLQLMHNIFFFKYLFHLLLLLLLFGLHRVSVAARRIFAAACRIFHVGARALRYGAWASL